MALTPGTKLGFFEIVAPLGAGGMGEVYRARDTRLGREVALKVLPPEIASDRERLARFAGEARSASALNHPNIVTVLEVGQEGSAPFIAMELVDGKTLRSLLEKGPLTSRKILQVGTQLADGLAKAHGAGIVHRDLKPENIMVTKDGYVKILDFGLAKLQGDGGMQQGVTGTGLVVGTAGYMSPEQASGKNLDFRSDQFSLGLIFYEMATGRKAFEKPTAVQTLSAIIQDEPEPIQKLSPKTPLPFVWLVERCLAKDPEERYAATRDLARDLRNLRDYLSVAGDNLEGSGPVSPMTPIETRSIPAAEGAPAEAAPRAPRRPASRANPTLPVGGATTVLPSEPGQPRATTPPAAPSAPSAHAVSAPRRSKASRAGTIAGFVLGGVALLAGGAYGGYLLSQQKTEAPAGQWTGELLLGGASRAFAPTISPDGKTLAFVTLVDGVAQVAVMTPGSGDWDVRTKQRSLGSVGKLEWSSDGSRIFFDRVTDVPRGIYSIPAVGGETERVVLEEAQSPVPLPDGSLLVVRVDAGRNYQISRFRPDTGKTEPVGPSIVRETPIFIVRAFADGKEAVFFGRLAEGDTAPQRRAFILDLVTGKAKPFAPDLHINPPFALTPSGLVIADVVTGDLHQLVSISRTGDSVTRLLPLAAKPRSLSAGQDGSLYVGLIDDPVDLLRFPLEGGAPEVLAAAPRNIFMHPVRFADGRALLPTFIAGKRRLLVGAPGQPLKPFIETGDQTAPPVAHVGADSIAYVAGGTGGSPPVIALASVRDGRLVKRLDQTAKAVPSAMAATPDGRTIYYVDGGFVSSVNVESGVVTKVRPGNGIAIDPRTFDLVVQMNEKDGVKLVRVGAGGETPVPFTSTTVRISSEPLSPGAFLPDGRLVVTVSSADSWFVGPAILNPETGEVLPIAVRFDGDVTATTWSGDALLAMGVGIRSELWRFRLPVSSEKAVSAP